MLGLQWNVDQDSIQLPTLPIAIASTTDFTNRLVLRTFAAVFDPLGLFSPVVFPAKVFFQKLWVMKLPWDDPLPDSLRCEWHSIFTSLQQTQSILLPCHVTAIHPDATTRLLAFTDASAKGYASFIYLWWHESTFSCNLVFSRVRLTPKKLSASPPAISLPRLELLGVSVHQFVKDQLCLPLLESCLWTDSQYVLP